MKDMIAKLQREFDQAELHADAATLRRLIADDFLSIGPKGFVLDKDAWIGRHVHFKYLSLDTSDLDIRVYNGAAIVRCVQRNRATYKGEQIALAVRASHMWVDMQGEWRLAGIQFSPLAQEESHEKEER